MTTEEAVRKALRDYLIRCFETVSKEYPPIMNMRPEEGADYLLKLKDEGKVRIELETVGSLIKCRISPITA